MTGNSWKWDFDDFHGFLAVDGQEGRERWGGVDEGGNKEGVCTRNGSISL